MKRRIRLSESDLHRVIKESVKRVLREHTWGETPELEDDEIPQEQIVKQGKNYVLKKGWYLGEDPHDTRGVTDYRCDIFLTQPQIDAFNNYVSRQQKAYINAGGHQYPEDHVYHGSYEDTILGMTKIYYGKLLDPHDDMYGRRIILKNFTDASGMPDEHNVRYYISKPE